MGGLQELALVPLDRSTPPEETAVAIFFLGGGCGVEKYTLQFSTCFFTSGAGARAGFAASSPFQKLFQAPALMQRALRNGSPCCGDTPAPGPACKRRHLGARVALALYICKFGSGNRS